MTVAIGAKMLLDAAKVVEDRHKTYGPPTQNFQNIADLWNAHLCIDEITPADVAIMMVLVKVARLNETPDHLDSWTDIAGYAACGAEVSCREAAPAEYPFRECGFYPQADGSLKYETCVAPARPNPSMPLVSEDVSDEDPNR